MTAGTETNNGIDSGKWYRYVITADPSVQKYTVAVYDDETGTKVGETAEIDMTYPDSTQIYFCFTGTWPMYLKSFQAYKPILSTMTVAADADVVKVPEGEEESATVDLSASLADASGLKITGVVDWSLADEYANVEIASTGAQTATLTVSKGASGSITVIATKDGNQAETEIQLTTSSNVVAFTKQTSSITIPFDGEETIVAEYAAETRKEDGSAIEGGAITYKLLGSDGVLPASVKGVSFDGATGTLTVESGASPAIVYVKATNEENLSNKVK